MTSPFSKRAWRLLPGIVASLITVGLHQGGAITPVEDAAYRGLFRLRGAQSWDERIVLITIDDKTLAQLGQYPLSRDHYTQLLQRLSTSSPAVIGFNILFAESTTEDTAFTQAMIGANNVVLASAVDAQGHPLVPVESLRQAAIATGHILSTPASDGLVHQISPVRGQHLALSLVVADTYGQQLLTPVELPSLDLPLWINWPGSQATLSQHSFTDVVSGRIAPNTFEGKIVLVGMTATGIDALPNPYDYDPPSSGLLLHAAALDNVLQQRALKPVLYRRGWVLLLLTMPALSYWLFGQSLRRQGVITVIGLAGWGALSVLLFHGLYWFPVVPPLLLWGLTGTGTILSQQFRASWALQQLLTDLWQHYRQEHAPTLWPPAPPDVVAADLGPEVAQLAELANAWGWAQATQSAISQTAPIGLLAADAQAEVWYCNALAMQWLPIQLQQSLTTALVPHWLDHQTWQAVRERFAQGTPIAPVECQQGAQWFELRFTALEHIAQPNPLLRDGRQGLLLLIENITHRKAIELQLRSLNRGLENEIRQRATELETINRNLIQEILERQQAQAQLAHQALHDELTGLPNRVQLKARLTELMTQFHRRGTLFAVLFIDCDRFKLVNDSFGHLVGDQLLQAIAQRLRQSVAKTDLVTRFGGDEFTLLLTHIRDEEAAIAVAQRLRHQLQKPFFIGNRQLYTGCSIGIVLGDAAYQQADEMLRDADIAMYQAKRSGHGSVLFQPEMHLAVRSSLQLETDLRNSLPQQELTIHYQPIFGIETQKIVGFEALLRWHHPELGLVRPDQFIPIAEETGMIIPIGQWVLQQACQQLRNWQSRHLLSADTFMSVNLSAQQFNENRLLDRIDKVLEETHLESCCLKLEITESALMTNSEQAVETFSELKDRGIRLGIDDFGTGYSSLSYLHHFPLDVLKVDRSFIQRMTSGQKHLSIVQAIKTLSHHFNMTMVAEGIETEAQMEHLRDMKCSLGQGYFFSPPLDSQSLEQEYLVSAMVGR
ncbi:MAG: EAL domain-containing protein [Leptolyngbya sp. SIOISBB]|nr:EAL domain-containing protein [Leptolyngbya sp. SIOISBB]